MPTLPLFEPMSDKASGLFQAAQLLLRHLERGAKLHARTLRTAMSEAFGATDAEGAWIWKDAYDAAEVAQVLFLKKYGTTLAQAGNAKDTLCLIERLAALAPSETRRSEESQSLSLDALRPSLNAAAAARSSFWTVILPSDRQPAMRVIYRDGEKSRTRNFDPVTGTVLPDPGTLAGSRFLYPFHYMLHIRFGQIGIWLVGLAGMAMLALCVSGVIIHRKIFVDFFTFRPHKQPRRMLLDLHNVTGVLGLPFHIAITLSGLIIFYAIYFPSGWQAAYPDRQAFNADAFDRYVRPALDRPGKIASLDAMAAEARRLWNGAEPFALRVSHPVIQFKHWTLRWLHFALGLMGCVLIATGYLHWLDARRKRHAQLGLSGVRIVEGLTIGSTTGIAIATLAFFVVNRLLPHGVNFLGQERAALEVWTFYLVWLATFAHAWARSKSAWIEQCRALAALGVAAATLNWITTGDHLLRSLAHGHLWPVAGMDLLLLAGAAIAAFAARRLRRRASAASGRRDPKRTTESQTAA